MLHFTYMMFYIEHTSVTISQGLDSDLLTWKRQVVRLSLDAYNPERAPMINKRNYFIPGQSDELMCLLGLLTGAWVVQKQTLHLSAIPGMANDT